MNHSLMYSRETHSSSIRTRTVDSPESNTSADNEVINQHEVDYRDQKCSPLVEYRMRRKLKFHFMDPCEKWRAKRKFPYKLLLQVIKIVLVTVQLVLFGFSRYSHVTFFSNNRLTFNHIFLKNWLSTRDVNIYPPGDGAFAVYHRSGFHSTIDHVVQKYYNLDDVIGSYDYSNEDNTPPPIQCCKIYYKEGEIWAFNESFIFNSEQKQECIKIGIQHAQNFSSEAFFEKNDFTINFDRLIELELSFALKTVHLKTLQPMNTPDCYQFNISILFDNSGHDGQIPIILDFDLIFLQCRGKVTYENEDSKEKIWLIVLNIAVILTSLFSCVLCIRALIRAGSLCKETVQFFQTYYNKQLSKSDQLDFLNLWYVMIIINDILIIAGSAHKLRIETKLSDDYNACGILLGTGNLLVWFGILRYLGFFQTYNVVILTMKNATPKVLRFMVCALIIYFGFCFCGWIVLGPYHSKFSSLAITSECLFSLINGDDMFATFAITSSKSDLMWYYSRVYFYSFIALFTYVVLSLFISIIMDTYETIKEYYINGFPRSDLHEFITYCEDGPSSDNFTEDESCEVFTCFPHCCDGKSNLWERFKTSLKSKHHSHSMHSFVSDTQEEHRPLLKSSP